MQRLAAPMKTQNLSFKLVELVVAALVIMLHCKLLNNTHDDDAHNGCADSKVSKYLPL